jgi:DNA replication protein DnaC
MAEILTDRYDMFIRHKMKTHITTNLTFQQIKESYGGRFYDRMKEMFNVISLTGKSLRK